MARDRCPYGGRSIGAADGAGGPGTVADVTGFRPSELQLPFAEFSELTASSGEQLDPEWRRWLGDWSLWDLACSPMPDEERRLIRYGHSLGWFAVQRRSDELLPARSRLHGDPAADSPIGGRMAEIHDRERRRREIINAAVEAADTVILVGTDGSVEEVDYLTAEVAAGFVEKVRLAVSRQLIASEILKGMDEIQAREEAEGD